MKGTIVACVIVALVVGAPTAAAAKLITGSDFEDGSITGKDLAHPTAGHKVLKKGAVIKKKLSPAVQEQLAAEGAPGPQGPAGRRAIPARPRPPGTGA